MKSPKSVNTLFFDQGAQGDSVAHTTEPNLHKQRLQKHQKGVSVLGDGDGDVVQVDPSTPNTNPSEDKVLEVDAPIHEIYQLRHRLGKGAYGIVWDAWDKIKGKRVALKKIYDAFRNTTDAQRTYREIIFLKGFGHHPNIIELIDGHKSSSNMDLYLVFPYMHTDLHKVITTRPESLTSVNIKFISYQIMIALLYLHSAEVIHRDLKPANILLDKAHQVKLADFGLSRAIGNTDEETGENFDPVLTDYVATRWYRPPEIMIGTKKYTKAIDMWSFGCLLGETLLNKIVFPGDSTNDQLALVLSSIEIPTMEEIEDMCVGTKHKQSNVNLITGIIRDRERGTSLPQMFQGFDPVTVDLIINLLKFDPAKRPNVEVAIAHPYFSLVRDEAMEKRAPGIFRPPLSDHVRLEIVDYQETLHMMINKGDFYSNPEPDLSFFTTSWIQNNRNGVTNSYDILSCRSNKHSGGGDFYLTDYVKQPNNDVVIDIVDNTWFSNKDLSPSKTISTHQRRDSSQVTPVKQNKNMSIWTLPSEEISDDYSRKLGLNRTIPEESFQNKNTGTFNEFIPDVSDSWESPNQRSQLQRENKPSGMEQKSRRWTPSSEVGALQSTSSQLEQQRKLHHEVFKKPGVREAHRSEEHESIVKKFQSLCAKYDVGMDQYKELEDLREADSRNFTGTPNNDAESQMNHYNYIPADVFATGLDAGDTKFTIRHQDQITGTEDYAADYKRIRNTMKTKLINPYKLKGLKTNPDPEMEEIYNQIDLRTSKTSLHSVKPKSKKLPTISQNVKHSSKQKEEKRLIISRNSIKNINSKNENASGDYDRTQGLMYVNGKNSTNVPDPRRFRRQANNSDHRTQGKFVWDPYGEYEGNGHETTRPYAGRNYDKRFSGPSFRKTSYVNKEPEDRNISTVPRTGNDREGYYRGIPAKRTSSYSAYFPNSGVGHPLNNRAGTTNNYFR